MDAEPEAKIANRQPTEKDELTEGGISEAHLS